MMLRVSLLVLAGVLAVSSGFIVLTSPLSLSSRVQRSARLSMHFEEALQERPLAIGQVTRERYVATNRFKVRQNAGPKFEQRWATRTSRLAQLDGFRWFSLLRRTNDAGADYSSEGDMGNYVSLTVWNDKGAFDAWRTGDAFKEAHGGGGIGDFIKLLSTALFILDGAPKPAFYDGLKPTATDLAKIGVKPVNGWRTDVVSDGKSHIPAESFVVMARYTVPKDKVAAFEQAASEQTSTSPEAPAGLKFTTMMRRDADKADDGYNYVSMSVFKDRDSAVQGGMGVIRVPDTLSLQPKLAFYEAVLEMTAPQGP